MRWNKKKTFHHENDMLLISDSLFGAVEVNNDIEEDSTSDDN